MTEEHKKIIGKAVRECYFYPYRSKAENICRLATWMVSWIVGIVVQQDVGNQALGGAYLIYSISLLLEFIPERKTNPFARVVHGLFCLFLILMLLGAFFMIFGSSSAKDFYKHYRFFIESPPFFGWIVFGMMIIGIVLVLIEAHKFFFDEEAIQQREEELIREIVRKQFLEQLNGPSKGENT